MKGQNLYDKAKKLIPTGTQLLSKRPERFLPSGWPSYYDHAKGVEVWDLDGNKYIDMSISAVGSCILGVADSDVDAAAIDAIKRGSMSTLNAPEEVELAELLIELHPWAEMVRYTRTGGEAMAVAIRIARAASGKDVVAFCGYHGWHDWYIAAQLGSQDALAGHLRAGLDPAGVPQVLAGTALPFHYNQIEELEAIVAEKGKALGAIVMEPIRGQEPKDNFLQKVRSIADKLGIPLIVDEISAGFRLTCGGAHLLYDLKPDIAVLGKGMSNGYPMAAIIGKRDVMMAAEKSFISSTYWSERVGPAAAIATIKKHRKHAVHEHLIHMGTLVQDGWKKAAESAGLSLDVSGMKPMSHFAMKCDSPQAAHTYFTQAMLERGFLASPDFYATFAHTEKHVEQYLVSCTEVFAEIVKALKEGTLQTMIPGEAARAGFKRYA
ncbi:MAG TPA: aminotransferase class III-fold pyridoxal phosphate-dependent enzyme [Candidatus Peribacterales bacterium]|nr:aminotransferase class III-fold pyridoxal phosphate-dependent enzyme [Candidatus Peribacterales bacterium]